MQSSLLRFNKKAEARGILTRADGEIQDSLTVTMPEGADEADAIKDICVEMMEEDVLLFTKFQKGGNFVA